MAFDETADLAAMFDSDEFATAALYKVGGSGSGVTKNVIFDRSWLEQLGMVSGTAPAALGIATDFSGAGVTDTLTINSVVYRIADIRPQDDGATVLLILAGT
jgi:hypothetical protein